MVSKFPNSQITWEVIQGGKPVRLPNALFERVASWLAAQVKEAAQTRPSPTNFSG